MTWWIALALLFGLRYRRCRNSRMIEDDRGSIKSPRSICSESSILVIHLFETRRRRHLGVSVNRITQAMFRFRLRLRLGLGLSRPSRTAHLLPVAALVMCAAAPGHLAACLVLDKPSLSCFCIGLVTCSTVERGYAFDLSRRAY